jgi:hypothetical protein
MTGPAHGADLRIYATVAVEGGTRLVPLPPGMVSTAVAPASMAKKGTAPG